MAAILTLIKGFFCPWRHTALNPSPDRIRHLISGLNSLILNRFFVMSNFVPSNRYVLQLGKDDTGERRRSIRIYSGLLSLRVFLPEFLDNLSISKERVN